MRCGKPGDPAEVEKAFASRFPTSEGDKTWAQVAMDNGHSQAVAATMIVICKTNIDDALKGRYLAALGVPHETVQIAQSDPKWRRGNWTRTLMRQLGIGGA